MVVYNVGSHQYVSFIDDKNINKQYKSCRWKGGSINCWFLLVKLKSSLRMFYGRHCVFVNRYGVSVSQMTTVMFRLS
jgi:hypothetical protein